jgi:hypothetical protein
MQFSVHGPDEPSFTAADGVEHLSRADAVAEVERCAFTTQEGRVVTHTLSQRGIGVDWDTGSAVETIRKSVDRAWIDHAIWGQCLAIIGDDGRVIYFDHVTPA